ncbi:MAG: Asp-tRNA(Asn)/Glu-tRNA(Gln) amidotransferase subunit GatA [Aeriscardovia sp.]|nr:Asp-tRNA(Asn)/Glu-tRNA(Gln) amidotransferase subunit GatA [Aeriscardovia sp.]
MSGAEEIVTLTASQMAKAMKKGDLSSRQIVEAELEITKAVDPKTQSYLSTCFTSAFMVADAVDQARAIGQELPELAGIPIAVKDMIVTKGVETTAASKILKGWVPPYDATSVEKVKESGMPILGKTNLDEFAQGSSTENSAFHPTFNPWDLERVPGGSGGGSAAAVSSFESPLALGTDTGGSIRQPASFTGSVGVKPTYGRVSRYGAISMASSLDQIGPCARTVEDAAMLFDAITGYDPKDSTSIPDCPSSALKAALEGKGGDLSKIRVGVISEATGEGFSKDVTDGFLRGVNLLSSMGAKVEEKSFPNFAHGIQIYYILMPAEVSSNLARYDGMRYGLRIMPPDATAFSMMAATREEGFGAEVKRRIMLGTYVLSSSQYDKMYAAAQKVRTVLINDFKKAFESFDVLVCPTSPTTAFKVGEVEDPVTMYKNDIATIPANLAGLPAISLPVGLDKLGLPIGFQIMADRKKDEVAFKVASALEEAVSRENDGPIWSKAPRLWKSGE